MAEDRTEEPSARRLLLAREQGQVARSPELTAAATLLTASGLLAVVGDGLGASLVELVRAPWLGNLGVGSPAGGIDLVVAHVRQTVLGMVGPLAAILGGSALMAVLVHQGQVGGLIAPGLIAPNPSRLWHLSLDEEGGSGDGPLSRAGRGLWSLGKVTIVVLVVASLIGNRLPEIYRLGQADAPTLSRGAAALVRSGTTTLALALLALGGIDYALQRRRLMALLRMTTDEHRADLRSADGDPAVRARRRALAKARVGVGGDAPELLRGASLVVVGPADITIVLAGGPPPRPVSLRQSAHGAAGAKLRQAAARQNLPEIAAPDLARALARLRTPAVPEALLPALRRAWPTAEDEGAEQSPV